MTEYYLPTGYGTAEHVEKKSRFIGQVWPVRTEAEAREKIEAVKKQHHDARHNCWCYALRDGTLRYSDDGEPQGTAGQPMLEVLRGQGVTDAVIVVTRYFGGILLGTGGLVRAYSRACAEAIRAAGVVRMAPCDLVEFCVPYAQWTMFQQESRRQGAPLEPEYGELVRCVAAVEAEKTDAFLSSIFDLSAGTLTGRRVDFEYRAVEDHEEG